MKTFDIKLQRDSSVPLGRQLKAGIIALMRGGVLKPGDRAPSVRDLVETSGVSYAIVARAVSELVAEGALERRAGVGVFVPSQGDDGKPARKKGASHILFIFSGRHGDLQGQYHFQILESVQLHCLESGAFATLMAYSNFKDLESALRRFDSVDGLVLSSLLTEAELFEISSLGLPMVFYGYDIDPQEHAMDVVCPDNFHGGELATRHLLELGHRRIAFCGSAEDSRFAKRESGYRLALRKRGVVEDERLICRAASAEGRIAFLEEALSLSPELRPTAFFGANDNIAAHLAIHIRDVMKLRIPGDVSVIGFDNRKEAGGEEFGLSSVDFSRKLMGEAVLDRLLQRMERQDQAFIAINIPVSLAVRKSTAPPPTA